MSHKITITNTKDESFSNFLNSKIKEFNNEISYHHREIRKEESIQYLNLIIENDAGEWLGGLTAKIYWNWLAIEDFWMDKDIRKKGIGSKLLRKAEEIAKEHECKRAFLKTFGFQAKPFYEKHGYSVVGKLNDYPPGSVFYWMEKTL